MITQKHELLQWLKRFAPLRMVQDQNFSDGVCFSMILKDIHKTFPKLEPQVMIDYKIKNLEALKNLMRQYQVDIDFDINKIARRDQPATFKLMQDLRQYWIFEKEADKEKQQPQKKSSVIPVTSLVGSQIFEPVQGLPITYTPSSQSQQKQSQEDVNFVLERPILDRLEQVTNRQLPRSSSRSPSPSPSPSHFTTPARRLYTPKIVNTFPEKLEEKDLSDARNTYVTSQGQSQRQSQIQSPMQSYKWSPQSNQSRSRASTDNQPPQYLFTTPIQNKFKQSLMQYSYSCQSGDNWLQMPKQQLQINQFNYPSQPCHNHTLNANGSSPHFGVAEIEQSSKALIDEFKQMQTSNNRQMQKDSIRKILRNIILDGKSLHTAQLQIQIIEAISGPEDQDLLEYKQWLQGQLQSQIPQGFITQDQATQYHSIDSQGYYAQSSQVIPRSQDDIVPPQMNQFQFSPQQLIPQQRMSQKQMMVQDMMAIDQRMSQSQYLMPLEQMTLQEQMMSQSQYMMPQEQIMSQEQMILQVQMMPQPYQYMMPQEMIPQDQMINLEQIPIEQRDYSQSITESTAANTQSQSQIQQSQNHQIFSQSTLPNSQSQNQIYSQNIQIIQQGSQGYDGQNY